MVDSRAKGARAELAARDLMRKATGHKWERTPGSGALNAVHKLKGDLYIPNENNKYLIEVKHYKEDQLSSRVTINKDPTLFGWWDKANRQAEETTKKPMVMYKWDRSKWYIISDYSDVGNPYVSIYTGMYQGYIYEFNRFFESFGERIEWV